MDPYLVVRQAASQDRADYRLDSAPLDARGQAELFTATHKASDVRVAMKRLVSRNPNALARMKREIECGSALYGHPHVMPTLDSGRGFDWFVMPLADGNAHKFVDSLRPSEDLLLFVE